MGYLHLPGVAGEYASATHVAAYDIVGNVALVAQVHPSVWASGTLDALVGRWDYTSSARAYLLTKDPTGLLQFFVSSDGLNQDAPVSTVAVTSAVPIYVCADWVAATSTTTFYTSTDGETWVQFGAPSVGTLTSIYASAADMAVGAFNLGGDAGPLDGDIYRAKVYDGGLAGTLAFDADFTDLTLAEAAAGSFVEDSVNAATVTINGTAWKYVRPYMDYPPGRLTGRHRTRTLQTMRTR